MPRRGPPRPSGVGGASFAQPRSRGLDVCGSSSLCSVPLKTAKRTPGLVGLLGQSGPAWHSLSPLRAGSTPPRSGPRACGHRPGLALPALATRAPGTPALLSARDRLQLPQSPSEAEPRSPTRPDPGKGRRRRRTGESLQLVSCRPRGTGGRQAWSGRRSQGGPRPRSWQTCLLWASSPQATAGDPAVEPGGAAFPNCRSHRPSRRATRVACVALSGLCGNSTIHVGPAGESPRQDGTAHPPPVS